MSRYSKPKHYFKLVNTLLFASSCTTAFAGDHATASSTSLDNTVCKKTISAKNNRVEIVNCKDIDLDLETSNGSKIKINSTGSSNTVTVHTSENNSSTVSQAGSGNTVIVTQGSDSTSSSQSINKDIRNLRKQYLESRKLLLRKKRDSLRNH